MKIDEQRRKEVLNGNLWKVVIYVTAPIFLYKFINAFYSLADQIMVSYINAASVSAVAAITQIKNLISSLGGGLAGGGAIYIARIYGSGDVDKARKSANVLFTMGLVLGLVTLLLIPFATQILQIAQVPEDLIELSRSYFKLQILEQVLILFNAIFMSIERSKSNTKVLFVGNLVITAIKLILNAFFIYILKVDDLVYVELASIIGQLSMTIIGLCYLFNRKNIFRIRIKDLSLKWEAVRRISVLGFPLFLGQFVISFGKVSVNAMCKSYGSLTVGALAVSNSLCGMITNPGVAIEDAESTMVSQNIGNKNLKRTLKIFLVSTTLMFIWSLLGFLCIRVFFEDEIINLFNVTNDSPEFVQIIKDIFYYDCLTIPALAINSVILGLLYGYGKTVLATVNNLLRIATRIGTLLYLQTFHPEIGSEAAGISMGISNIAIAIMALIIFAVFIIRLKKKGYKGMRLDNKVGA